MMHKCAHVRDNVKEERECEREREKEQKHTKCRHVVCINV